MRGPLISTFPDGPLEIVVEDAGKGAFVISLNGELDLATAPALAGSLHALREQRGDFIIDLRELRFIDSTGVRLLLRAQREAFADGRGFALRRGPAAVHRIFELAGLCDVFVFEDSG